MGLIEAVGAPVLLAVFGGILSVIYIIFSYLSKDSDSDKEPVEEQGKLAS